MKIKFTLIALLVFSVGLRAQTLQTFYDFSWPTIHGDTISMSRYIGKKVMVVNVASYCTYTPEFAPLSQLDSIYAARYNFAIIGFPCNDFGHQGGTDSAIIHTCTGYHVNFQIMSTVKIITGDTAPLYKWLQRGDLNGVSSKHVTWNFNKFLIDRQGHWVRWFDSPVDPLDTAITNWIIEDSASAYTGIKTVNKEEDKLNIVSANPTGSNLMIEVKTSTLQKLGVDLYTIDGRLVGNIYTGTVSDLEQIDYSTTSLSSGVYIIKAQGQTFDKTLKCVVQH
jgi:glutathione peroxidase